MLIHIGDNISLLKENIIMILDKKTVDSSKDNLNFIENLIEKGALVNNLEKDINTYIVTMERYRKDKLNFRLYISNISSTSLVRRQFF